jgi:hypothetical protein
VLSELQIGEQLIRWPEAVGVVVLLRFACVGHRDFKSLNARAAVGFACEFTARVDRRAVVGCDSLRARVSVQPRIGTCGVLMHSQCANERHQKFTRGRMNDDFGISLVPRLMAAFASGARRCLFFRAALTFNHLKCLQMPATDALSLSLRSAVLLQRRILSDAVPQ